MSRTPFSTPKLKIVLLGGGGFVGYNIAKSLQKEYEIIIVDMSPPINSDITKFSRYIIGSITNLNFLQETFDSLSPISSVIHLASIGMSGGSMLEQSTFKLNVQGTQYVINACLTNNVSNLIYISTYNVVFGGQPIHQGDETAPVFPVEKHTDKYSASKAVAELMVLAANGKKLKTCALRPAAIYGEGEQRHIPRILTHVDGGLFMFRIGKAIVDWIHVDNLTHAIDVTIKKMVSPECDSTKSPCGKPYFISDGTPIDNFEFLKSLCEARLCTYPKLVLPTFLFIILGKILEKIYHNLKLFSIRFDPFLTQAEVMKVGITHNFSIQKAKKDLGYIPLFNSTDGSKRLGVYYGINGPGGKQFNKNFFRFAHIIWWIVILSSLSLLYYLAFRPYNPSETMRIFIDPLRSLGFYLFRNQKGLKLVFYLAILAHVFEACLAYLICKSIQCECKIQWIVQTFLLGYPSLQHLLKRQKDYAKSKALSLGKSG